MGVSIYNHYASLANGGDASSVMDDLRRVNLTQSWQNKLQYKPNEMNCVIGYRPIASSRVPRHVAYSGRVGLASSVMDDLCRVNLALRSDCFMPRSY